MSEAVGFVARQRVWLTPVPLPQIAPVAGPFEQLRMLAVNKAGTTMTDSEREQTKLLATALNTASVSCFTVGIATPVAGYLYNVGNFRSTVEPLWLALGLVGWLCAAAGLHLMARRVLKALDQ
jgi:hypothetical protein